MAGYTPPTLERIREVAGWDEADSPAGNHALNCLEVLLAEHDVVVYQRDALVQLVNAQAALVLALRLTDRPDLIIEADEAANAALRRITELGVEL